MATASCSLPGRYSVPPPAVGPQLLAGQHPQHPGHPAVAPHHDHQGDVRVQVGEHGGSSVRVPDGGNIPGQIIPGKHQTKPGLDTEF